MKKNLTYLFSALAIISAFYLPKILAEIATVETPANLASIAQKYVQQYPIPKKDSPKLEITAEGTVVTFLGKNGESRILYYKNATEKFSIASITKIITALAVKEIYAPNSIVTIPAGAEDKETVLKIELKEGKSFALKDLVHLMLIESNNSVANILAQPLEVFIPRMNDLAQRIGMKNTNLKNPSGLDPKNGGEPNYSTPLDLITLGKYLIENEPEILNTLSQPAIDLYDTNNVFYARATNTNELLDYSDQPIKILGGKTGTSNSAKQTFLIMAEPPRDHGYIIVAILGSNNRFEDTKKIFQWLFEAYDWPAN